MENGGGGDRWWCITKRQKKFKKNLTLYEQAKSIYIKHMCTYYIALALSLVPPPQIHEHEKTMLKTSIYMHFERQ